MTVKTLISVLIGAALLAACTSTYMIRGEGGTSCATMVERVRDNSQYRNLYGAWLLGYLTRYNYDNDKTLGKGFDDQTLVNTAVQYCTANPLDDFDQAANYVVEQLLKKT